MSNEAFQMVRALDRSRLEAQIALQCAPVITGVKISNLLTLPQSQREQARAFFRGTGLSVYLLYQSEEKVTFLVYSLQALIRYLERPEVRSMMEEFGYQDETLDQLLARIAERYQSHLDARSPFPHEIGLILGYPAEDVSGFIRNQGKNFLYTGYWKVYGNLAESKKTFQRYDRAKEYMIRLIAGGGRVHDLLGRRAAYYA